MSNAKPALKTNKAAEAGEIIAKKAFVPKFFKCEQTLNDPEKEKPTRWLDDFSKSLTIFNE